MNRIYQHPIGKSVHSREIIAESNFDLTAPIRPANITLIIGGLHGDEKATVALVATFREQVVAPRVILSPVIMIPMANPDGFVANSRYNANRVDLNRNCDCDWRADSPEPSGPHPWSEPETRAIRDLILSFQPAKIVSLHWALAELDPDGPQSAGLARSMWESMSQPESAPYRIRLPSRAEPQPSSVEGFCPGSFGQWCGYALRFAGGLRPAMVTLELPYDPAAPTRPHPLPPDHLAALHARWTANPSAYLAATQPAVHKMLAAACRYPR